MQSWRRSALRSISPGSTCTGLACRSRHLMGQRDTASSRSAPRIPRWPPPGMSSTPRSCTGRRARSRRCEGPSDLHHPNGCAAADQLSQAGNVNDTDRVMFLHACPRSRALPSCPAVQGVVRFQDQTESSDHQPPPRERAIPRANVDRLQATPSYGRRLLRLVKCPVSPLQPRPATPGR
jgi:hypothetical protein